MRIQHNIMAMSAYRNYTSNVSAMKKNLEKLSSGYKINRAGDDAAGLAISEKMRAQITGLETAQKNAKDGISLVQTAEGALTEVHDMLNRMVELATQSANGTYDNTTDRAQLQKEMNQLLEEIDRIADSSNFNGIKLLDGSLEQGGGGVTTEGIDRIISTVLGGGEDPVANAGVKTILDGGGNGVKATKFDVDFTGLTTANGEATAGVTAVAAVYESGEITAVAAGDLGTGKISAGGYDYTTKAADADLDKQLAAFVDDYNASAPGTADWTAAVGAGGKTITFTAKTAGAIGGTGPANAPTGTTEKTKGVDAVAENDGKSKVSFKLGGTEFAKDVEVDAGGAAALATAVFGAITDADAGADGKQVSLNGATWNVTDGGNGKLTFELVDAPTAGNVKGDFDWDVSMKDDTGKFAGNHTAGTVVTQQGQVGAANAVANTVFNITAADIKDGTQITVDDVTVTLAVGPNSQVDTSKAGVIDLTSMDPEKINIDQALGKISEGFKNGTTNFIVGVNDTRNDDAHQGLTVHKKGGSAETYDTKEKLAAVFSMTTAATGKPLTLQIGDTAETYNQLKVDVADCHTSALGIKNLSIANQEDAAAAITKIKDAVNKVSDTRGTLGATQNRLDHTINNLGVMTENIQDAESTIRDVDIAEEMMAYTKNNILIQSAQAMLAQANQVPQGVLQLLQ